MKINKPLLDPDAGASGGTTQVASTPAPSAVSDQAKMTSAINRELTKAAQISQPNAIVPKTKAAIENPREVKPGEEFSLDGFGDMFNKSVLNLKEIEEEIKKPAEEPEVETEVEAEIPKTESTETTEVPEKPKSRDYSKYPEEIAKYLKKVNNWSFAGLSKYIGDLQEAKQSAETERDSFKSKIEENAKDYPSTFYEHENAYVVSPKFQEINQNLSRAQYEANHYREQLSLINAKKPWKIIEGYSKDGTPVFSPAYQPSEQAKLDITNAVLEANQLARTYQTEAGNFANSFATSYKQSVSDLTNKQAQFFDWVKDPKKESELKVKVGGKEVPIKDLKTNFKGLLGPQFSSSPLTDVSANLFVALQIYGAKIAELESKLGNKQAAIKEARLSEPNTASTSRTKLNNTILDISNYK
jgi:hypothetical protein